MNKKKMITLLLTLCALLPLASCGRTVGEGAGRITTAGADSAPAARLPQHRPIPRATPTA